tara:strand:+ start:506 stop:1138 length:633 start_codon:yes stop_codon:yes gene_type:complete
MALNINGSTGISGLDGSASAPPLAGTDSNTGISFGADTIKLSTGGVERLEITNDGVSSTGHILQVLQTVKTDMMTTSTSGFQDITNLSVAITPRSNSNKILIHYDTNVGGDEITFVRLVRGSTAIGVGDATGQRIAVTQGGAFRASNNDKVTVFSGSFLDSPNTTSETTYKLQLYLISGTAAKVNAPRNDTNAGYTGRSISTITVMEVAA